MRIDNLKIPQVFRVLVIDDQLCSDKECVDHLGFTAKDIQDHIVTRYLQAIIGEINRDIGVQVVYAKDPDEGVAFWLDQIFDLTLVDSDLSKSDTSPREDSAKRNFLDLNLQYTGAYLYRFLREMMKSDENKAGREGCKIAFWTGLGISGEGKENRAKELLSILTNASGEDPILFIPKKEDEIGDWKGLIDSWQDKESAKSKAVVSVLGVKDCINGMRVSNPVLNQDVKVQPKCIMERIKRLYPVVSPGDFMKWCGTGGYVYAGCLYERDGKVNFSDQWDEHDRGEFSSSDKSNDSTSSMGVNGGDIVTLSPVLRCRGARQLNEDDVKLLCPSLINVDTKIPNMAGMVGWKEKGRIVAAATPLTGCSAVNEANAIKLLCKKVKALLDGPFGKVVLKTVYLDGEDQWNDFRWPELQAQERGHVTRCYRSTRHTRTLWNTGTTANEGFSPAMLNQFLLSFAQDEDDSQRKTLRRRVIVSLGSKYPKNNDNSNSDNARVQAFKDGGLKCIWEKLFGDVFSGIEPSEYPIVEINVRHYLRECLAANFSGNEYLSPAEICGNFTGNYEEVDKEFTTWIETLDAVVGKRKLLLKLPFRGDILHFIRLIDEYRIKRGGQSKIIGITLINSYKSAEGDTEGGLMYSPAWYGLPNTWGDVNDGKNKQCQMSGEMLAASRNELISEIVSFARDHNEMEVHISGGVIDHDGIMFCLEKSQNIYVQIGTWALMNLDLSKNSMTRMTNIPPYSGGAIPEIKDCKGCNPCSVKCSHAAFITRIGKSSRIDATKCVNCKECIEQCKCGNVDSIIEKSSSSTIRRNMHRMAFCIHELCDGCGRCSRTFYCDTFLDRRGMELPPLMEPRNCTGCGLCAQTCPRGAIQLFEPKDFVLLVGKRDDPKLAAAHRFLFSEEIPHLVFYNGESKRQLADSILRDAVSMGKFFDAEKCLALMKERELLSDLRKEVESRLETIRKVI